MNARAVAAIAILSSAACGESPKPAKPVEPVSVPTATVSAATTTMPTASATTAPTAPPATPTMTVTDVPLRASAAPLSVDLIAIDRPRSRVWVPVGNTGSVEVLDIPARAVTSVEGFKTAQRERDGKKRTVGPSAVTVGDAFAYVGNAATGEVCPVDATSLKPGKCLKLPAQTDALTYVPSTKEVWVTMPQQKSLAVVDASKPGALTLKATFTVDGEPECFAVDDEHGLVFTNLEDKGGTVAIDAKTHKPKSTWNAGCSEDGPRGVAFDAAHDFLVVACIDHLQVLDAGHDGARLGRLDVGAGIDNIDFVDGKVYAAAGRAAKLVVASLDAKGGLDVVDSTSTSAGVRNAVADGHGNAFAVDARGGRILTLAPPAAGH